jgi:pimeloyl-ACP methyl ester carboxylesterase
MPFATVDGTRYAYEEAGEGPLLLFGHGLLASRAMFRAQVEALSDRFRCVSIDWPGHGESGWREEGFTFDDLARDAAAVIGELGAERAILAGLSQGGMIFMRLALTRPELVEALILMDTSAAPEPAETKPQYEQLAQILRDGDEEQRRQVVPLVQNVLYGQTWLRREPGAAAHEADVILGHPPAGVYLAWRAVADREDITARLGEITAPTLVICGAEDVATPPDRARKLQAGIPGAELAWIPEAGHHSPIENPAVVIEAIEMFLDRAGLSARDATAG